MAIPWNGNIPQPSNLISVSQGQILTNNQTVDSVFNDATNGNFTKFLVQAMGSIATPVVDPVSAYHTVAGTGTTFSGKPLPFFKNSVGDYPLMPDLQASGTSYSFKIGNLIIKFGKALAVATNTAQSFTPVGNFTTCLAVFVSGGNASGTQPAINVAPATVAPTEFFYKITNGPADAVFWLAIGT